MLNTYTVHGAYMHWAGKSVPIHSPRSPKNEFLKAGHIHVHLGGYAFQRIYMHYISVASKQAWGWFGMIVVDNLQVLGST